MYPAQVWCHYAGITANRMQPTEEGHMGNHPPNPALFNPVVNDHDRKPFGGLWTSSYTPGRLCDWMEFAGASMNSDWVRAWVLMPEPDVRLYEIDSHDDLVAMLERYPWLCSCAQCQLYDGILSGHLSAGVPLHRHPYDAEAMAADGWDGIHLTRQGQNGTRFAPNHRLFGVDLNGWDCESTLWFRWRFREVRYFGYWHWTDPWPAAIGAVIARLEAEGAAPEVIEKIRQLADGTSD